MLKNLQQRLLLLLCLVLAGAGTAWAEDVTINAGALTNGVLTSGDYKLTFDKATGSSAPAYNENGGDLRLYAKGTLKIESSSANMTKIVFNISTQGKKRLAPITASVGTVAAQASNDETVTWTGDAKEVTFTVGEKADYGSDGSSKAGQLCFSSVVITPSQASAKTKIATVKGISPVSVDEGDEGTFVLDATFPEGLTAGTDYKVTWETSDDNTLDVGETTGEYQAYASGNVNITVHVKATDGDKYDDVAETFAVTVKKASHVKAYNEVFYESFDGCKSVGGNDGGWKGINPAGAVVADNEGWTFDNGSAASGCAKLGTGSKQGTATTPAITLGAGVYTLSFMAGAWDAKDETTTLKLSADNAELTDESVTLTKGAFSEFTTTVTVAEKAEVKITFAAANASSNRFFLDEVQLSVKSLSATVKAAAGWATFVPERDVEVASGVAAYIVSEQSESSVTLAELLTIPAGTPVLLEGSGEKQFTVIPSDDLINDNDPADNLLQVVKTGESVTSAYVLAMPEGKPVAFYQYSGSGLSVGQVYLPAVGGAREVLSIGGGETTGISNVEDGARKTAATVYDLQGRRVATTGAAAQGSVGKGLYIVNGKKMTIK